MTSTLQLGGSKVLVHSCGKRVPYLVVSPIETCLNLKSFKKFLMIL